MHPEHNKMSFDEFVIELGVEPIALPAEIVGTAEMNDKEKDLLSKHIAVCKKALEIKGVGNDHILPIINEDERGLLVDGYVELDHVNLMEPGPCRSIKAALKSRDVNNYMFCVFVKGMHAGVDPTVDLSDKDSIRESLENNAHMHMDIMLVGYVSRNVKLMIAYVLERDKRNLSFDETNMATFSLYKNDFEIINFDRNPKDPEDTGTVTHNSGEEPHQGFVLNLLPEPGEVLPTIHDSVETEKGRMLIIDKEEADTAGNGMPAGGTGGKTLH